MPAHFEIENIDDVLRCFDKAPDNMLKMVKTALRTASRKTARSIRTKAPANFRRLVSYKVFKGQVTQKTNALIGLFNKARKANESKGVADWRKAYWKNYGTLQRRDPQHVFGKSVSQNTRRRNNLGQPFERFFEAAIRNWEGPFVEAFAQSLKEQEDKLYDR